MKRILTKTVIVFLLIGGIVMMQSCEENLETSDQTGINGTSSPSTSSSTNQQIITVNDDLQLWFKQNQAGAEGNVYFVYGPASPPLGIGSLQFKCPDKKFVRFVTNGFSGVQLKYISEMSYSTYVEQSTLDDDNIYLVLQVDLKGDGIIVPLNFNPEYQTGKWVNNGWDQGPIIKNTWQAWDLFKGLWWQGPPPDPDSGKELYSLEKWINMYPKAKIANFNTTTQGSIRIQAGSPVFGINFVGYLDNFHIKIKSLATSFDFERP